MHEIIHRTLRKVKCGRPRPYRENKSDRPVPYRLHIKIGLTTLQVTSFTRNKRFHEIHFRHLTNGDLLHRFGVQGNLNKEVLTVNMQRNTYDLDKNNKKYDSDYY